MTAGVARQAARRLGVTIPALLAAGCGTSATPSNDGASASDVANPPWFEERATAAGILFTHVSGHRDRHYMPEIMAGGAATIDLNNDGWMDLYLVQSGSLHPDADGAWFNRLYRNRGDGTFQDITAGSGADDPHYGLGVAVGDYDNDGFADLYVTNYGRNTLLRNNGDETFTDVTDLAGVGDRGLGTSAAFADLNLNGDLDLIVINYLVWSPASEINCFNVSGKPDYCLPTSYNAPAPDVLYRNDGDGAFTDVSARAGLRGSFGNGLGVVCLDANLDGLTDIFISNDKTPNQLWQNEGALTFRNIANSAGCAVDQFGAAKAGMGVVAADLTGDGYEDLLVVNLQSESDSLYRNMGGYFLDETMSVGLSTISRPFTRFGLGMIDFNNDGHEDIYQANGGVFRRAAGERYTDDPYAEPNLLLRGTERMRFEEVTPRGGTAEPLLAASRAAAFADFDNDGGVDLIVVNRDGPAHLLRNIAPHRGRWIRFRVLDEHGRDAYHARLSLTIDEGSRTRRVTREVRAAYSYLASNDPRVHIGLGEADRVADVAVTWPGGRTRRFGAFPAGEVFTLRPGFDPSPRTKNVEEQAESADVPD